MFCKVFCLLTTLTLDTVEVHLSGHQLLAKFFDCHVKELLHPHHLCLHQTAAARRLVIAAHWTDTQKNISSASESQHRLFPKVKVTHLFHLCLGCGLKAVLRRWVHSSHIDQKPHAAQTAEQMLEQNKKLH